MNEPRRPRRWLGVALIAALGGIGVAAAVAPGSSLPEVATTPGSTGMCRGRSDANIVLTASNNGLGATAFSGTSPGYEIEIETDAEGHPTGALVSGHGADELRVDEWCRLWAPGSLGEQNGEGEAAETGASMVHAVGFGEFGDGTRVFVRTDVKSTEDGMSYRIRYRELAITELAPVGGASDQLRNDEGWTRIPEEEWAPLTEFEVHPA